MVGVLAAQPALGFAAQASALRDRRREAIFMAGTFLASEMRILWRTLRDHGIEPAVVCRKVGLDPAFVDQPRARYPFDRVAMAWAYSAKLLDNPYLGLEIGRHYRPTDFHGIAVVFLASDTLRTGLKRWVRDHVVVNTAMAMQFDETGDGVEVSSSAVSHDDNVNRVAEDARAAIIADLCRTAGADTVNPLRVCFTYPEPTIPTRHAEVFRCPIVFDAPEWKVSFRNVDADAPFLASNRELARSNDQVLEQMSSKLRPDTLVSQVKLAILDELPSGTPPNERIAKLVGMSTRSLQRKLSEEHTSYNDLLTDVGQDLAEHDVRDPHIPVTEIGFMLGFSDGSAFSRAFKRWTGKSPVAARQIAATPPAS